jgi:hypothetical protein
MYVVPRNRSIFKSYKHLPEVIDLKPSGLFLRFQIPIMQRFQDLENRYFSWLAVAIKPHCVEDSIFFLLLILLLLILLLLLFILYTII